MKTMRESFPTVESLLGAPVFDIAGVIIELLATTTANNITANRINGWTDEYKVPMNSAQTNLVRQTICEAWNWLQSNGLIAEEITQGGSANEVFITRAGRKLNSRASFLAYTKATLLPTEMMTSEIAQVAVPLFLSGHFDAAVGAAFIQVEVLVRKAGNYADDEVGVEAHAPEAFEIGGMMLTVAIEKDEPVDRFGQPGAGWPGAG